MSVKPILFNTEMVRAMLEGRKCRHIPERIASQKMKMMRSADPQI